MSANILLIEGKNETPSLFVFVRPIDEYPNVMRMKDSGKVIGHIIFSDNKFKHEENNEIDERLMKIANKLYPLLEKENIYPKFNNFKFPNPINGYILVLYTNRPYEEAIDILNRILSEINNPR